MKADLADLMALQEVLQVVDAAAIKADLTALLQAAPAGKAVEGTLAAQVDRAAPVAQADLRWRKPKRS